MPVGRKKGTRGRGWGHRAVCQKKKNTPNAGVDVRKGSKSWETRTGICGKKKEEHKKERRVHVDKKKTKNWDPKRWGMSKFLQRLRET